MVDKLEAREVRVSVHYDSNPYINYKIHLCVVVELSALLYRVIQPSYVPEARTPHIQLLSLNTVGV